jgi:hypothetical protein
MRGCEYCSLSERRPRPGGMDGRSNGRRCTTSADSRRCVQDPRAGAHPDPAAGLADRTRLEAVSSHGLAPGRDPLGFRRLALRPDSQRHLDRSDLNHRAVCQPHFAGDERVLHDRAVLAPEVLKEHRIVSANGSNAGVTTRDAGRIEPDRALGIPADGVVPVLEHDHPLVPHQPESNRRRFPRR